MNSITLPFFNYSLSYWELVGTLTSMIAVLLSTQGKKSSWLIGLIGIVCFFVLFYKNGLYSDMFLQIYFFITGIYGWINWSRKKDEKEAVKESFLSFRISVLLFILIFIGTLILGYYSQFFPQWFPSIFNQPTSFPYSNAWVAVASVVANYLLAQKKVENWLLWIGVNGVATVIYYQKNLLFLGVEYAIFLIIAVIGLWEWNKKVKKYQRESE